MALLTTASATNRVTHAALAIRYAVSSKTKTEKWEVHRYTTKSFSYVGLTEAAAKTIAENIAAGLKRTYYIWQENDEWELEHISVQLMQDEVVAVHDSGPMWRVDVNVNEDDMHYVDNIANDLSLAGWPSGGNYHET